MRNIPKSLHTVTVLVNLARFMQADGCTAPKDAIRAALHVIGYSWDHDPYGLADAALKQFAKGHDL